jgi:hypothetical protein
MLKYKSNKKKIGLSIMINNKDIDTPFGKVSPYSEEGIYNVIYAHLIKEWKGLSTIEGKKEKLNFSDFLKEVIDLSLKESEMHFENNLIDYVFKKKEDRIARFIENNASSMETKKIKELHKRLVIQSKENQKFDLFDFQKSLKIKIKNKYDGLINIYPKDMKSIGQDNLAEGLRSVRDTKDQRLNDFKGLSYKYNGTFHFIDAVSAPIVFYNQMEQEKEVFESLILGISSYAIKINEIKNTKKLIRKLEDVEKKKLKVSDPEFTFEQFDSLKQIKKTKKRSLTKLHDEEKTEIQKLILKNKDP